MLIVGRKKLNLRYTPKMGIAKTFLLTTMNFFVENVTLNLEQQVFLGDIITMKTNKVIDFIHRRFPSESNWLNGNCYYFALILFDRFPMSRILYDAIDGHFVCEIEGVKYDWSGVVKDDGTEHSWIEWNKFQEYDNLQYDRIVEDCLK